MPPRTQGKKNPRRRFTKLGTAYGGWYLPEDLVLSADDVCYLAGAGEDISFDCLLAMKYPCQIHIFDPTPRAIEHYEQLVASVAAGSRFPVNNSASEFYEIDPEAIKRLHFHPWGLSSQDKEFKFYAPKNPAYVSHSIMNLQKTEEYFTAHCKKFCTICQELQHDGIALMKIDIEGAEYQVIQDLIDNGPLPRILLVEFDEYHSPLDTKAGQRILDSIEVLQQHGMEQAYVDCGNVTFLRADA